MTDTIADMTLVDHQKMLEELYSKNQLMPRLRAEVTSSTEPNFTDAMTANGIPIPFGVDVLVQIALHKRANLPTMIGCLFHHLGNAQATADMLSKCVEIDLLDWDTELRQFIVIWTITQDTQEDLDRFQYPLPMVVPPKEITNNKQSGYYLNNSSVILRDNHHEDDVCLDHLNRLNRIKFSINADVARMVKNKWKHLDKPKEYEKREDYEKRVRAFQKYDRTAKDVIDVVTRLGNEFHLTHKVDKRGRTYCQGYHISYQSNDWCKATIEFADKELVT